MQLLTMVPSCYAEIAARWRQDSEGYSAQRLPLNPRNTAPPPRVCRHLKVIPAP